MGWETEIQGLRAFATDEGVQLSDDVAIQILRPSIDGHDLTPLRA
jgi:hypothetical protein